MAEARGLLVPQLLSDHLSGRDNNLNLIRIVAAAAVLVSHAYPIALGPGTPEPLEHLTGMTLGGVAVAVFFALSGLLIARSFDRKRSLVQFAVARILRLFPALFVVLILTVIAGAAFTTLSFPAYFLASETLTYVPRNMSLAFLQYPLPGVFDDNAYGDPINGSLWTLFYEVVCYLGVVLFGMLGLLRRRFLFTAFFVALFLAYLMGLSWNPDGGLGRRIDILLDLAFPFSLGMMAYVWREQFLLDLRICAGLWLLCLPLITLPAFPVMILVALIYTIAWFGFVPKGRLLRYNRLGDYSYGVYIFAFPVQQMFAHLVPEAGPLANMAMSAPVTLFCAVISWNVVESVALSKVRPISDRLTRQLAPS